MSREQKIAGTDEDEDDEDGGFYVPTALAKAGGTSKNYSKSKTVIQGLPKPSDKSKKKPSDKKADGGTKNNAGPKSMGGPGSINNDLNNSARRAQTISSDADPQHVLMRSGAKPSVA